MIFEPLVYRRPKMVGKLLIDYVICFNGYAVWFRENRTGWDDRPVIYWGA